MKLIGTCLLILFAMNVSAQSREKAEYIKGKCYEGYVFPAEYSGFMPIDNFNARFTPTKDEVKQAEEIIKEQLKELNKNLLNQTGKCPVIHKKLSKYKRQYVGIITAQGEKIVWVNFVWGKDIDALQKWKDEIIIVLDGCSYYWNVKVNLNKGKLFDLSVNGSA